MLDFKEKRYLRAVLEPFKEQVRYLIKYKAENMYFLVIYMKVGSIHFPEYDMYGDKYAMYSGLEDNKAYDIKDLEIF